MPLLWPDAQVSCLPPATVHQAMPGMPSTLYNTASRSAEAIERTHPHTLGRPCSRGAQCRQFALRSCSALRTHDAGARKLVASTLAQHKQRTKCTRTRSKATLPTHVAHSHLRLHLLIRLRSNVIALRVARLSPCSPRGTCTPTVPVARGAACAHIDRASTPSARRC